MREPAYMGGADGGNREIDGSGWVLTGEVELEPWICYHFLYHSDAPSMVLGSLEHYLRWSWPYAWFIPAFCPHGKPQVCWKTSLQVPPESDSSASRRMS